MAKNGPSSQDLSASREPRFAKIRLDRQQRYLAYLRLAKRIRTDNGFPLDQLDAAIKQGDDEREMLDLLVGGRIFPRKRPRGQGKGTCTVFIDECGAHSLTAKEKFKAFALSAVIVRDEDYRDLDRNWKNWKRMYLGRSGKLVHEPDLRTRKGSFYCNNSSVQQDRAINALDRFIARQYFGLIVCVLQREEYVRQFGNTPMDQSLPHHGYLMTIHFMMERIVMALEEHFQGGRAKIVMESRGKKEDATVQYEFARLFLDGSSYITDTWMREALCPGIEFREKKHNITGLQLADLAARPVAEKVLDPASRPPRWAAFRTRLCAGFQTGNSILGLKIVPWDAKYELIWES